MYQYRIIQQTGRALKKVCIVIALLFAGIIALELLKLFAIFKRIHPIVGWAYLGALVLILAYGLWHWLTYLRDHDTLEADDLPPPDRAKTRDLVDHCRYLARVLRRLSGNAYLEEEHQRLARQTAYDIENMLHHRPTLEDLTRAIINAEQKAIAGLHAHLDTHAHAIIRDKTIAVVSDVIQPPFPVVNSLVVIYHEITLTAAIAGVYITEPAVIEYWNVMKSTWRVLTRGDFIRIGQSLFAGVYANCPLMGRGIEDLGQAISSIWLTRSVAQAALYRCKTLRRWTIAGAIAEMDTRCHETLTATREALIHDILPILKTAFHHKVPRAEGEAPAFMSNLIAGIIKAVDIVMASHKSQPLHETVQRARRTEHGTALDLQPGYVVHQDRSRRRRSGHSKSGSGINRLVRTISQRIKYTSPYSSSSSGHDDAAINPLAKFFYAILIIAVLAILGFLIALYLHPDLIHYFEIIPPDPG